MNENQNRLLRLSSYDYGTNLRTNDRQNLVDMRTLVSLGLVQESADPRSPRRLFFHITPKGREVLNGNRA